MTEWAPPGEVAVLVADGEPCPDCGQIVPFSSPNAMDVQSPAPRRAWLVGAVALLLAAVGISALVVRSGDDPPAASGTTTTAATPTSTPPATTPARPSTTSSSTVVRRPPVVVWPAALPDELRTLAYVVGGPGADDSWLVTLDSGPTEPLWLGDRPPRSTYNVFDTRVGVLLAGESNIYLRGAASMSRLAIANNWNRPVFTAEGMWHYYDSTTGEPFGRLAHRALDDPGTVFEQINLPTWGWLIGVWNDRPLVAVAGGAIGGTVVVRGPDDFERVAAGEAIAALGSRLLQITCDEQFTCAAELLDLETAEVTVLRGASPGQSGVALRSSDGSSVVLGEWQHPSREPVSVNLVDGTIRRLSDAGANHFGSIMSSATWGAFEVSNATVDPSGRYLISADRTGLVLYDIETDETWTLSVAGGSRVAAVLAPPHGR